MTISRDFPRDAAGAGAEHVDLEAGLWSAFTRAKTDTGFLTGWLAILLVRVAGAEAAALLEPDADRGSFLPRAVAPDPRRDLAPLRTIAERSLASGRPASEEAGEGRAHIAYPLREGDGPVAAVVVVVLDATRPGSVQAALRDIHWAAGWLAARLWERRAGAEAGARARAAVALDLVALLAEHRRPEPAAMALVNELQTVLKANQVAVGMLKGARASPRIRLLAMSHAAWFRRRSAVAEALETAMEECFDQAGAVAAPPIASIDRAIAVAHQDYLRGSATRHILSVPLPDEAGTVGVISVERRAEDAPFTEDDLLMAETVAAVVGPILELKRRNRRWLAGRLLDGTVHVLGVLLGPRRLSWKLLAVSLIALAVAAATVTGPFRVQAEAVLRGETQRAAVAPFAGYVEAAPLRAGDRVAAGALLARLDETDLRLEELRWRSEIDRLSAQSRDALAQYDRAQLALLQAQIEQARAQLRLTEARLARSRIAAPIDGVIVSGDLSQRLGAPVQAGEVLFEVAPLDAFRIDIWLDERDLRFVEEGQSGRLVLTGDPGDGRALELQRITPVAEVQGGINAFRLEARLVAADAAELARLRPGMEGIAKIDVDRALVSWIWTRRLVDWLRRTLWVWQP